MMMGKLSKKGTLSMHNISMNTEGPLHIKEFWDVFSFVFCKGRGGGLILSHGLIILEKRRLGAKWLEILAKIARNLHFPSLCNWLLFSIHCFSHVLLLHWQIIMQF